MPTLAGTVEKTMEAESVGLLRHILQTALREARERNAFDIVLFIGVDGRIFASEVPPRLDARQYRLLNLVKSNLGHICHQLSGQNMMLSVQQYDVGTIIISGVGDKAFLVFLSSRAMDFGAMQDTLRQVLRTSVTMKHVFEERPITPETLAGYDEEVARDLRGLSRTLFVEKFEDTRGYKRNMEVLDFLRKRLTATVGVGPRDEILTMAFNEVGTSAAYMEAGAWDRLLDLVCGRVAEIAGDAGAETARREWTPQVKKILAAFV